MSRQRALHSSPNRGAYTISEVCERISMPRSTFYRLRDLGELTFLEEAQPRLGKRPRYRADLVEQYVANTFNRDPRLVSHPAQPRASRSASKFNSVESEVRR